VEHTKKRRQRLREAMGPKAAALVASPGESIRNADNEYLFRAHSSVLYLSGFAEPNTLVLVLPESHATPFVLFVQERDREKEQWVGRRAGVEGAKERFGADEAHVLAEIDAKLAVYLEPIEELYVPFSDATLLATVHRAIAALGRRKDKPRGGPRRLVNLEHVLGAIRRIKQPEELVFMREAAELTVAGHRAAFETIRPGVPEYVVEAAVDHAFRAGGGNGAAFGTIVGAGVNATILHYLENHCVIQPGDAVLVDAGAEVQSYSGDVTRTYTASGRFSSEQRALYEIVLQAEKDAIAVAVAGNHVRTAHEVARRVLIEGLLDLKLLTGDVETILETETFKRFFMHGTSHYLGLDTHDVGEYFHLDGTPCLLEPGVVVTIEPGLYVSADDEQAPEAFRGIGIRIEDDVLITADGNEVLTAAAPKELSDIEYGR